MGYSCFPLGVVVYWECRRGEGFRTKALIQPFAGTMIVVAKTLSRPANRERPRNGRIPCEPDYPLGTASTSRPAPTNLLVAAMTVPRRQS